MRRIQHGVRSGARSQLAALLASISLLLAACAGAPATPVAPVAPVAQRPIIPSDTPRTPTARPSPAKRLGPAQPDQSLSISLLLKRRSPDELARLLAQINDPSSPLYHHYLTPRQIAARFGADPAAISRAKSVLRAAGLTEIAASPDGARLDARGTVARLDAFFATTLDVYRTGNGGTAYAPERPPVIPSALAGIATQVLGLDTRAAVRGGALARLRTPQTQAGPQVSRSFALTPDDLVSAYNLTPLRQSGLDGSGQTIAIPEIDTFSMSDVQAYDQAFGITPGPIRVIRVGRGANSTSPEPVLDIEVLHAIAPRARILVYEGRADLQSIANTFNQIVNDNAAQVVSISLGACERQLDPSTASAFLSALDDTFSRAQAQGMSVLVASGDNGAYDCGNDQLSVGAVAANPYVTAVGGTALFLDGNGGYGREAGWEGPLEGAGSGGGVSVYYRRPSWQQGPGVSNRFSTGGREVPDVSAVADPLTGYAIRYRGQWQIVGGTSASTPLWAGIIALANQRARTHLGFLNPALYRLGAGASASQVYHDVTLGGNLYYDATRQWDYSTGWGSPDAAQLVPALIAAR